MRFSQAFMTYRLPIVAGFLIGTSYIPLPPWAIFFGLVPLFVFWKDAITPKQAFIGGWVTQFILNLIGFHWIAYTAIEFGHFPVWGGALTLIGFASVAHLYYALAGWFAVFISRKFNLEAKWFVALGVLCFAILEEVFPMIFPWHLGYPWLWAGFPGAQFADVIGFDGLNLVTLAANALLAYAVLYWKSNRRGHTYWFVGSAITLLIVINLLGIGREKPWLQTDAQLDVIAVQGNIGNFDKLLAEKGREFRKPIIEKYVTLSRQAMDKNPEAKLLIWPETAFPDYLDPEYVNDSPAVQVRFFIQKNKIPLLTGSYSYDPTLKETYNGFFFIDETGKVAGPPHRKSILLVFGETFPFSEYLPYMDKLFPDLGSFGRGKGPMVMNIMVAGENIRIGPQVCYEGLYPWFSAGLSKLGAQILTNVTNDSWFGREFEPKQHLYMTLARAIEFRRPLLRSTNTGITTAITASGEILSRSEVGEEWSGMFKIPYTKEPKHTFYEKIAGQWPWALAFLLVLLLAFGRAKRSGPPPQETNVPQ
ncbi:MAG: apolipoprotein N-acyltransferase [Bdellovibrionota bacterium]